MVCSDIGGRVADFAAKALAMPLPATVVEHAKLHIIDSLAAIVSGAVLDAGIAGQKFAMSLEGPGRASILGTPLRAPQIEAALANGMAAHADESDDSHELSQTHPGCGVVPAAIVVAEAQNSTGVEFMRACVLGYEMAIRFGLAFGKTMSSKRPSLASHAYGPLFGGGYAAGALHRFSSNQFRILLNYLGQEASGLTTWRLDDAHTLKSYCFAGMPASNAVKCALLVQSGFTGSGDALDAKKRSLLECITSEPNPQALIEGLGEHYGIVDTDIKYYTVGYPIAAPLAAIEKLLVQHAIDPAKISAGRVYYDERWYKVVGDLTRMPDVNLRYCLAVTLLDGRMSYEASHDVNRMGAADVIALGKKFEFLGPLPHLGVYDARVELDIDGKTFGADQDRNVLGRIENPMSKAQVHSKARELMLPVLGTRATDALLEGVANIESTSSVRALIDLMRPACGAAH